MPETTEDAAPHGLFQQTFTVPETAIDGNGHANNLEYLRWMLAAAQAHSDAAGWTLERYATTRSSWVVRSHHIDYLRPAYASEELTLVTWIGDFEERSSTRHYLLWRERDRKVLAQAQTLWVFVEAGAGRACAIPDAFRAAFEVIPDGKEVLRALRNGLLRPHFTP
jgi:acyl-CoA thioester hydrolase